MPVADVARMDVMTATRDQSAGNLADVMSEENVGSVIIVDEDEPVGIVTDRDIVLQVVEPRKDPAEVTAGDLVSGVLASLHVDDGIFEATAKMDEHSVRRMPVVGDEGSVAGIVTLDDLIVMLTDELDNLSGVIESESPPY